MRVPTNVHKSSSLAKAVSLCSSPGEMRESAAACTRRIPFSSIVIELRWCAKRLSQRKSSLVIFWLRYGWVEKVDGARGNRSHMDVAVRHARVCQSVEVALGLKKTARWLENDQISVPRRI